MYLIQVLLPLYDNEGTLFPWSHFEQVRTELTEHFGGLTAYTRAPAEGLWKDAPSQTVKDDIVIHEVMAEEIEAAWWNAYRASLEERFRQDVVVIRAQEIRVL
jgi:hypothetical protein